MATLLRAPATVCAFALFAATAQAKPARKHVDVKAGFRLVLPGTLDPAPRDDLPNAPLLVAKDSAQARVLVVARIKGPTDGAYSDDPAFFTELEQGVRAQSDGFERLSARRLRLGKRKVPAYDLWFRARRDGRPWIVGARFLFFRGYALSLVLDASGKRVPPAIRRTLESFVPVE